jgi:bacterioferritin-associated ferredoxin
MVNRCVCFNKRFSELKEIARRHDARTLEELQQHVTFGENCRRCHPYVRLMLATGRTVFEVIPIPDDSEPT